jgi:hypothetical protein
MRHTRLEVINELYGVFGHNEETEQIIDWVRDTWETSDFLVKRVGRESAYRILNAMDLSPEAVFSPEDLTPYNHAHERYRFMLN